MSKWLAGIVCLAATVGCGGGGSHPTGSGGNGGSGIGSGGGTGSGGSGARCVPGDSKSCTGPGPCSGYQVCQGDGTDGVCNCSGTGDTGGSAGGTGGSVGGTRGTAGTGGRGGAGASGGTGGALNCTVDAAANDDASAPAPDAGRDAYVSDGPSSAAAFQSLCAAVRSSIVARKERCDGFTPAQALAFVIVDPCGAWGGALDRGHMSFDASKADACVASLGALSCAADVPPTACDGVLTGLVVDYTGLGGPGGGCNLATQLTLGGPTSPATASIFTECMPGSFCNAHDLGPPFVCLPLPKLGEVCVAGVSQAPLNHLQGRCAAGGVCDHTGHCATPKPAGDPCTSGEDCARDLYCASNSTCAAKHATGSCASSSECIRPATCNSGSCGVRPRGGCCASINDCAINEDCPPGGGNCFAIPVIGQACGAAMPVCLTGICNGTTKLCQPISSGGNCPTDLWCGLDAICLPVTGSPPICEPATY
jgi:hypothetical protein